MISYYDIRHAKNAMRHLQTKVLRRRKLDIHYSIPKDNPSDKDVNQGTLVVFNLDPSITNEELLETFGAFGEIKEIRYAMLPIASTHTHTHSLSLSLSLSRTLAHRCYSNDL
jgi:RNA recognition motif-containing protein